MNPLSTSRYGILLWSSNLWNFADGLLGPLFAVFAGNIGGNVLDIAWAWGAYLIVTGVFIVVVGYVSDRLPKLPIIVTGYFLTALFTFGYIFISTPFQLFVLQALLGFALALTNPTHYALMNQYSAEKASGSTLWGWADGRDKIATGLAVFAGGLIVHQSSFTVLFIIMGTLQLLATAYLSRLFWMQESVTPSQV